MLWLLAVVLIVAYRHSSSVQAWLHEVETLKRTYGYAYSAVATALFGGLIPFAYLWARPKSRRAQTGAMLLFLLVWWAYRGVEVDFFYRLQAQLFGDEPSLKVVATKVVVDQFVYNPLWAAPVTLLGITFSGLRFRVSAFIAWLTWPNFRRGLTVMLISTWLLWVPAVAVIYAFPSALQVPLFNLVLCFFMLMLAALSAARH